MRCREDGGPGLASWKRNPLFPNLQNPSEITPMIKAVSGQSASFMCSPGAECLHVGLSVRAGTLAPPGAAGPQMERVPLDQKARERSLPARGL